MEPERWRRVRALFESVAELSEGEREARLAEELAGALPDEAEALRGGVEELLAAEAGLDVFLEPPTLPGASAAEVPAEPPELEGYRIERRLGAGGMGVVYEAEQRSPRRRVALKVLHPGGRTPEMLRRFADEAALLARLQHPGIARLYEAGIERGDGGELPWFAMELVEGARPITEYVRAEALDLARRVELLREVCEAVHHGHQRGVIHRDLKPANLLVGTDGRPVVIDFGVARATDAPSALTRAGAIVGTLAYMSPEQVAGPVGELDVRADVYALGCVLYELAAGRPPFALDELSIAGAARVVCEEAPPDPSRVAPGAPRELDWVVARALAKDREERYGSASDLARELGRFLGREALEAGPPTAGYRLRAFVRRNRLAVGAGLALFVAVVGGLVGTGLGLVRALEAEGLAREEQRTARSEAQKAEAVTEFLVDVLASAGPGRSGLEAPVGDVLERAAAEYRERFEGRRAVRARLGAALGEVFHGLGADERAEEELRRTLTLLESDPESPPREVADVRGQLGTLLAKSGRLEEAAPLLEAAVAFHRESVRAQGEPSRGLYRALGRLGELRLFEERRDEAEALLREAHGGLREVLGPGHRDTCLVANSLAGVLHESRRYAEAEPIYAEALAGLRALWGEEHPDTLRLRHNLGMLRYAITGDPDAATPELAAVHATRREVLGPDHPDTLASLANLSGLHLVAGRLDEAGALYDEGLASARESLGLEHPTLQTLTMNASALARRRGRYEEARRMAEEVRAVRFADFGAAAEATLNADFALVQIDRERGAPAEALERCEAALAAIREGMGRESLFAYHFELEAARCALDLEWREEAGRRLDAAESIHAAIVARHPQLEPPTAERAGLAGLR